MSAKDDSLSGPAGDGIALAPHGAPPPGAAGAVVPEAATARSAYVYHAHAILQDMVRLADQKAATILAGGGIVVALVGSNLIKRFTEQFSGRGLVLVAGAAALVLMSGTVLCAICVLLPRFPSPARVAPVAGAPRLMWAGDIAQYHRRPADYVKAVLALTPAEAVADVAYENLKIAWILERKWRWLGWATRLFLGAFIAWCAIIGLALKGLRP